MGIRTLETVFEMNSELVNSTQRLVLLALADNANEKGVCYPKQKTIAAKTSLNEKTVSRVLKQLREKGYVSTIESDKARTVYLLTLPAKVTEDHPKVTENHLPGKSKVTEDHPKVTEDHPKVTEDHLEGDGESPSNRTVSEPSYNHQLTVSEIPPSSPSDEIDPPVMDFPLKGGGVWKLTKTLFEQWKESYPAIDVESELNKARSWNLSNKDKQKTKAGMAKHLNSWLSRASAQREKEERLVNRHKQKGKDLIKGKDHDWIGALRD